MKSLYEQVLMKLALHYKQTGSYQKIVRVDDDAWIELLRDMHGKTLYAEPDEFYNPLEVAVLIKNTVIIPTMYGRSVCDAMNGGLLSGDTPIDFFRSVVRFIKKEFNVPF